jgi:uncharacterized protein (DUF362 family)
VVEISRVRRLDPEGFGTLMISLRRLDELKAAGTIVIKPNLTAGPYSKLGHARAHMVSDPQLLRDVVTSVLDLNPGAIVYIAEGDSTENAFAFLKFARFGLPDCLSLSEDHADRVALLDLSRDRLCRIDDKRFEYFSAHGRQLWLSETLVNADFVISLSNCKTHVATLFSGACKNLFGCLPAFDKSQYHPCIHEVIHDVTIAISPHLSVVDAFCAMEGNGPIFGDAIDCGYRVFSEDATEADYCACQCAGFTPIEMKYLNHLMRTLERFEHPTDYPTIIPLKRPSTAARTSYSIGVSIQSVANRLERYGQSIARRRSS